MDIEIKLNSIELCEPAFGETPKRFDTVDVGAASCERLLFVDSDMFVLADIDQTVVFGPAVRAEDALRVDPTANDGPQGVPGAITDDFGTVFPLAIEDAEEGLVAGSPAAQAWQRTTSNPVGTKITFIDFHHSLKSAALVHPVQRNQQTKALVKVDGLTIEPQQRRRLCRRQIQKETR